MILVLIGDLPTLAETVVLLLLFLFLGANVSVLVLRANPPSHAYLAPNPPCATNQGDPRQKRLGSA